MLDPGKPEDACGRGSRTSLRERLGHYAAEGMSGHVSRPVLSRFSTGLSTVDPLPWLFRLSFTAVEVSTMPRRRGRDVQNLSERSDHMAFVLVHPVRCR